MTDREKLQMSYLHASLVWAAAPIFKWTKLKMQEKHFVGVKTFQHQIVLKKMSHLT